MTSIEAYLVRKTYEIFLRAFCEYGLRVLILVLIVLGFIGALAFVIMRGVWQILKIGVETCLFLLVATLALAIHLRFDAPSPHYKR
jgi:hypothetical protein